MNLPVAGLSATALLLGSVAVAHAQPAAPSPSDDAYRSPATASLLAFGGVAASGLTIGAGALIGGDVGVGLAFAGVSSLLVTPSIGHFYSGDYLSAGFITRLAGTASMGAGVYLFAITFDFFDDDNNDDGLEALGALLFTGGGIAFVTGTIVDLAFAGTAAERWNAKHGYTLAPTVLSTPSGTSAGLGFSGRF